MTDLSLSRSQMLLLAGSGNRALAEEVAAHLGQPLCQVTLRRFADGELFVKIDENVRGGTSTSSSPRIRRRKT